MSFSAKVLSLSVIAALAYNSLTVTAQGFKEGEFSGEEHYEEELEDFYGDEDFVSIATGNKTLIHKAPSVASVFTSEQIKNMGATDIDDVLESVPGLHISRFSNGYLPIYTFRGMHTLFNPQVLMLINNIPITNNYIGNRNQIWGGMPVESIARIEVIRGPGSAIFGADAFAGVINIITKNADDIKDNEVALRLGSLSTKDAWFSYASSDNELKYAMTFEYHKTNGSDKVIETDAQTNFDSLFGTSISLAPSSLSLGTENMDFRTEVNYLNWTFRAGLQKRDNAGIGAGLGEALDPTSRQASTRWNADINYKNKITNDWLLDMQLAYFDTSQTVLNNYIIFPEGAFGGAFPNGFIGNPEVWERHSRFNITGEYSGLDKHLIRLGAGYHNGDMYKTQETKNFGLGPQGEPIDPSGPLIDVTDTPYIFLSETKRRNTFLSFQDVWSFANDWELTAGLRYDKYSDFGSTTNPRLALVWATTFNLSTKLLYGKAFRAPSFAETGNINNPVALGNPDLTPERMETIELAFDYHPQSTISGVLSFYKYNWQDIILFVPDTNETTSTAQNAEKQEGYGVEVEVRWELNDYLNLLSNFTYSKATNKRTDNEVAFVSGSQFYLQLDWQISDSIQANFKSNWVNDRKRDQADLRAKIDDYIITDATLRWTPQNMPFELALLAKNIFNEDAREPSINNGILVNLPNDLPLLGRSIYGELRFNF